MHPPKETEQEREQEQSKIKEHSAKKTAEISDAELAEEFLKAIGEAEENHKIGIDKLSRFWKKFPLWKRMFKLFTDKFLNNKKIIDKNKKQQQDEKGGSVLAGGNSVKALSAELEAAVAKLKSVSRLDTDANDYAMMEAMEKVMQLSSKLAGKIKGNTINVAREKADVAVAEVSTTMKNSNASVIASTKESKALEIAADTTGETNKANFQGAATAGISDDNLPSIELALKNNLGKEIHPSKVMMTKDVEEQKNAAFTNYLPPKK